MLGLWNIFVFCILAIVSIGAAFTGTGLLITALFIIYCFLVFWGAKARAKKLTNKIESNLTADEILAFEAVELRPYALFHRRFAIAVTNNRVIFLRRKVFGGFSKIEDWQWKFIFEATIEEHIFPNFLGADLNFSFSQAPTTFSHSPTREGNFIIRGISSDTASKIYNFATLQKQEWSEKNRIRQMEESRAASGGYNVQGFGSLAPQPTSMVEQKLQEAKSLLDKGFISNAEFQERKSKILGDI
jgi:hypothetical protein